MARLASPRRLLSYSLSGLLIALLLFLVFGEWGVIHYWHLSAERARLEERTLALQRENEILREKIYRLGHDDRYREKVVREQLGFVREGEIIYRFPNVRPETNPASVFRPSLGQNARP